MTTLSKESVDKVNSWFKYIDICNRFNPAKVDGNTIFGHTILEGFKVDPDATIRMIQDQIRDNAPLVKQIIGEWNFNLLT